MTFSSCCSVSVASQSAADMPRVVSMRMSRGPSLRNEKPRAASSTWGEEMPRSSRMPSTCCKPRPARAVCMLAKLSCTMVKRGSAISRAVAMAGAAEGAVNIDAVGARARQVEAVHRLVQQYSQVLELQPHRHRNLSHCGALERKIGKNIGHPTGHGFLFVRGQLGGVPDFKM